MGRLLLPLRAVARFIPWRVLWKTLVIPYLIELAISSVKQKRDLIETQKDRERFDLLTALAFEIAEFVTEKLPESPTEALVAEVVTALREAAKKAAIPTDLTVLERAARNAVLRVKRDAAA